MLTTLRQMFTNTFNKTAVLQRARDAGVVQRLRGIHPADLCLAVTTCAMGDETRSIASARREFYSITHYMPEESSFYDRFTPELVNLLRDMFNEALASTTREQRAALATALQGTGIVDVEAIDGSQITLPASAADRFPSTSEDHGGVKLTATLSVLFQTLKAANTNPVHTLKYE